MKRLIFFGTRSVCRGNRTKKGRTQDDQLPYLRFYIFISTLSFSRFCILETERARERERENSTVKILRGRGRGKRNMVGINTGGGWKCGVSFVSENRNREEEDACRIKCSRIRVSSRPRIYRRTYYRADPLARSSCTPLHRRNFLSRERSAAFFSSAFHRRGEKKLGGMGVEKGDGGRTRAINKLRGRGRGKA